MSYQEGKQIGRASGERERPLRLELTVNELGGTLVNHRASTRRRGENESLFGKTVL